MIQVLIHLINQRIRSKLGDAVKEVYNTGSYGWYSDNSYLARSGNPWINRGGSCGNGSYAGVFHSGSSLGNTHSNYSSRLVITP